MAANDSCCCISESIITHCSPDVVVIHFKDKKSCELRPPTSRTVNDRFNILVHSLAELQQSNRQMSINQLRHLMYNLDVTGILWQWLHCVNGDRLSRRRMTNFEQNRNLEPITIQQSQVIMYWRRSLVTNLAQIRSRRLLGKQVKYNIIFII